MKQIQEMGAYVKLVSCRRRVWTALTGAARVRQYRGHDPAVRALASTNPLHPEAHPRRAQRGRRRDASRQGEGSVSSAPARRRARLSKNASADPSGYIDLSKRRVSAEDVIKCEERYNKSKAVHSITRHVAEKAGVEMEAVNEMVAWPLYRKYGHAFEAFKLSITSVRSFRISSLTFPASLTRCLEI